VAFEKTDDRLVPGDVVLMVSDGVLVGGEAWVELFLRDFDKARGMQALCDCLVAEAVKRQDAAHSDDVTVCALQLAAAE
jgi:hypothetical protein